MTRFGEAFRIYQSYYKKYEILEIRKKERDLEEILLEVFHETD